MKNGTIGELRRLIADLPDDALIRPDWANGPPGDSDPAVSLEGFTVGRNSVGEKHLSVLVDIKYFGEAEEEDDG